MSTTQDTPTIDDLNDGFISRPGEDISPEAGRERRKVLSYLLGLAERGGAREAALLQMVAERLANGEHTK